MTTFRQKLLALVVEFRKSNCVTSDPSYGEGMDTGYNGAADSLEKLMLEHDKAVQLVSNTLLKQIKEACEDSMLDDFVTARQNGEKAFKELVTPELVLKLIAMAQAK